VSTPEELPQDRLPGLGLAAYVGLLAMICLAGMIGLTVSTWSLVVGSQHLSPQRVSYGGVVDPAMLAPLREAGLIGPKELPDAFHAETVTGSEACAISGDRVVRLSDAEGAQTLLLADISEVSGGDSGVVIRSATATISCVFRPGEGGGSFRAMLDHR
jgi:hypothetical protein